MRNYNKFIAITNIQLCLSKTESGNKFTHFDLTYYVFKQLL